MGTIITRKQGNNTYYLYQETYREKVIEKSAVQEKLWKIFELEKIEKQLSLHK